jgi:protein-tyrosine phosphatase
MPVEPEGFTDLHSHLVPGVDDGSRTLEESLEGVERMWSAGVRRLVTTPHLNGSLSRDPELLRPRLEEVDQAWEELKAAVSERFPGLEFQRGHEVMLDIPDPDLSDIRLHLAETHFVLVEWPGLQVPPGTLPALERLVEKGIRPIIAHPERYRGLDKGTYMPGEWRAHGALLQVNYGSLLGRYGDLPRRRAFTLMERGWVDLMASDFHGRTHLSPNILEAREALLEAGGGPQFGLLAGVNPSRIFRGEDPLTVPPLPVRPGFLDRIKGVFQPRERQ